jgi:hypothetical protein
MKYLITWNAGYGDTYDIVEAKDLDDADKMAYEEWKDEAETQAKYGVENDIPESEWEDYL